MPSDPAYEDGEPMRVGDIVLVRPLAEVGRILDFRGIELHKEHDGQLGVYVELTPGTLPSSGRSVPRRVGVCPCKLARPQESAS